MTQVEVAWAFVGRQTGANWASLTPHWSSPRRYARCEPGAANGQASATVRPESPELTPTELLLSPTTPLITMSEEK